MMNAFVCEDNSSERHQITTYVSDYIMIHNLDIKVALSTDNPLHLLDYVKKNKLTGLYFLDIDLNHDVNGLKLAEKIRQYDPRGFIVFITTHGEAMKLTFRYKVEAMDFIIKDNITGVREKINSCVRYAYETYVAKKSELLKVFTVRVYDKVMAVEYSQIVCFETNQLTKHKIILHAVDREFEFYGNLTALEKQLNADFFRCHRSFVVNLNYIDNIDRKEKAVILNNKVSCPVSSNKMKKLLYAFCAINKSVIKE